CQQNAHWPLTV
nr:immunoglobulin light chain junction region [Macaca mulatta]